MAAPFLLLMPSYNQAGFIREAVESCLAQDDPHWELWILDNSTDATPEVMRSFGDPRIRFIHEPRRMDPGTCLNRLLELARGEHFSYLHTDNRLLPDYVRRFRSALSEHPLALAYCDYFQIDAQGRHPRLRRRPRVLSSERIFSCSSIGVPFAATTALARKIGGFSTDDLADDAYFVMRADGVGPRVHVGRPLLEYRVHERSRAQLNGAEDVVRSMYRSALKAYGLREPGLPDPFLGMEQRIRAHVARAARAARVLSKALLARVPAEAPLWIEGTGPSSFWLGWASAMHGRIPRGFRVRGEPRGGESLLGLPVVSAAEPLPRGHVAICPRRKRLDRSSVKQDWLQPLRWILHGLPARDGLLKRYPASVMSSLLIPLHHRSPGEAPVWVRGSGAMGAYLAFGAVSLAGLPFEGWIADSAVLPAGCPTLRDAPAGARVWKAPGEPGDGASWSTARS